MTHKNLQAGFTLIELMIVVLVIGILATIGIANFASMRERSLDATMKSDLRNAMLFIEDYRVKNEELPPDVATFEADTGFDLSPNISWIQFQRVAVGLDQSVEIEVKHSSSLRQWYANYPTDGSEISLR